MQPAKAGAALAISGPKQKTKVKICLGFAWAKLKTGKESAENNNELWQQQFAKFI